MISQTGPLVTCDVVGGRTCVFGRLIEKRKIQRQEKEIGCWPKLKHNSYDKLVFMLCGNYLLSYSFIFFLKNKLPKISLSGDGYGKQ